MKKFLVFALLQVMGIGAIMAGTNPVSLTSGSASMFSEAGTVCVVFDYDSTMVQEQTLPNYLKSRGDDFVKDWPKDKEKAESYFTIRLSKKSKLLKYTEDAAAADYKMIIHVNWLDMGNTASSFFSTASAKDGGVIMRGTIDIMKGEEVVATFDAIDVKGTAHPSETVRLGLCYFELCNGLLKAVK